MPRLLILCEYPTLLGGERSMLATLDYVREAGFDVAIAAPPKGPLGDALERQNVRHVSWQTQHARGIRYSLERLRDEFDTLVADLQPSLVHANSLSTSRIAGPVVARRGLPSIGHLRDIVKLPPQAIVDVNSNKKLIAVSLATRDFHVKQGIDATKCNVVYNGIDLADFQPRVACRFLHRELDLPPHARLIATIGQLGLRKGTDVALVSARQVVADFPNVHWLVIGERTSNKAESHDFEAKLHDLAWEFQLAGRVHFLGTRNDIPAILNECDILVHAARQEPLGRVLLEAAACGMPIVATDVGGTREIFPSETHGAILVPPDDPSALAAVLQTILLSDERRCLLGQRARKRIESVFDIRTAAARLIEQYQLAMAGAG